MTGKVLVVGSLNIDLVVTVPRLPQISETIIGGNFATFPGGKGANQAVAAARMGATVSMIGLMGNDAYGWTLCQVAAHDTSDTKHVEVDPEEPTGIALITVDADGRNTIVVASGANLALTSQHVLAAERAFSSADVLVTQLGTPLEAVGEAVNLAAKNDIHEVLNLAPARSLAAELLSQIEFFISNEREAMQVVGVDSLEAAIEKLLSLGVRHLVITLGEQGVLLVTPNRREQFSAHKVQAIDTIAAGDAFVGAFSTGIAEGMDVEDAIRPGNSAAAVTVTRRGAQPSLPTRADVNNFLRGSK